MQRIECLQSMLFQFYSPLLDCFIDRLIPLSKLNTSFNPATSQSIRILTILVSNNG